MICPVFPFESFQPRAEILSHTVARGSTSGRSPDRRVGPRRRGGRRWTRSLAHPADTVPSIAGHETLPMCHSDTRELARWPAHHGTDAGRVDLQLPPLIAYRVVVGDDAVLLHTQHIGQTGPHPRHKRGARFHGGYRKAPVIGRDEPLAEKLIRGDRVRDARLRQLLGQSILQRAKDTLGAAPGFR